MKEIPKNVWTEEKEETTMGLVERQRAFLAWFVVEVQNCLLYIFVGSKNVLDSRNGHIHEENSSEFLRKIKNAISALRIN